MALQFMWAFFATGGYCFIFNVPRRHIPIAATVGAAGWITFEYLASVGYSNVAACFFGSCVVALLSDICSRAFKEAATVFIIPGILPLVPGAGMYHTMLAFLETDFQKTAQIGWETSLMACGIAVALLIVASILKVSALAVEGLRLLVKKV